MHLNSPLARVLLAMLLAAPASAAGAAAPATPAVPGYLTGSEPDLRALLAPPPAPGSAAQQQDLAAVLAVQRARTSAQTVDAIADLPESVFRVGDVLGPRFTALQLPLTAALFNAVTNDVDRVTGQAKVYFNRARPFVASPLVHPLIDSPQKAYHRSYPNGHAALGATYAILLAELVPEQRAALFERGRSYGQHRIVDGVHYPSDTQAGQIDGTLVAAALLRDPRFNADLQAARKEVRRTLGLP